MVVLGIETSCDETACAVVEDGTKELSSVLATSKDLHEKTGGIVPEVAARKQVESIVPVIKEALDSANKSLDDIDMIGVTVGPGLIGSLVVGVAAAKGLSLVAEVPVVPVNHLVGHMYANFVDVNNNPAFPAVVLVVSGGHTDLVLMHGHGKFGYLGGTLDDAAGEAFDKTARLLGIKKYLGGSELSKMASKCKNNSLLGRLPRPKLKDDDFDFSFSGLKTAVKRLIEEGEYPVEDVACEFESAVVEVLVDKTVRAARKHDVKSVLLGGGVASNVQLRSRLKNGADRLNVSLHIPPPKLCTDNAVYIASSAYFNRVEKPLVDIKADPSLGIMDKV